ncbi:MAG: hypothetical protein OXI63_18535 [Candidatus Poribacteria bacterium]|nr:hypothetical protein [Candidatus Poribacteria bacterium]
MRGESVPPKNRNAISTTDRCNSSADKAEVAHYAGTLAREAFSSGEITVQEAERFIEDVSGLDVTVKEKEQ